MIDPQLWHCHKCHTSRTLPPVGTWGESDTAWYRLHEPHGPTTATEIPGQLDIFGAATMQTWSEE